MASNGQEAKFSFVLENGVSRSADAASDSLDHLRQRIAGGEDAIKNMRSAFNRLRGSTDEIKAAKAELTAKLNAERDAVSAANLKLLRSGTTYDTVSAKAKKLATEQEHLKKSADASKAQAMGAALTAAGGPAGSLRDKLSSLKEAFAGIQSPADVAKLAAIGVTGAVVALTAAVVVGIAALGKWIITTANAERSMGLFREAAAGSTKNAFALGTQIDALSEKVPTSREALNQLATTLAKGGIQGQTLVDTLNAVGQASSAMDEAAGSKLKELVDRGRLTQRFQVNPMEMQGTGLQFDDIAKALAKNMKVGIGDARRALAEGRVKLGDGAKALRLATEEKFGDINLRKSLDIDVIATKFREKLAMLTADVKLEPFLKALNRLVMLFDTSTNTGSALKVAITAFGDVMGKTLTASMPFVEMFLKGMIIGALDLGIGLLQLRNSLRKTFGDSKLLANVDMMNVALSVGKGTVFLIGAAFVIVGAAIAGVVASFAAVYVALTAFQTAGESLGKWFKETDWAKVGTMIVDGLVDGLKFGAKKLTDTVTGLATSVKKAFTGELEIQSPSKVFKGYGVDTAHGYAEGVADGTPDAARALGGMAEAPSSGSGGGSAKATAALGNVTVEFHYHAAAGSGGGDVAAQIQEPAVRSALMRLLQEAFLGKGVPVAG